jgi:hypothetical protein
MPTIPLRGVVVAAIATAFLSVPLISVARAEKMDQKCRFLDTLEHRCLASKASDRTHPCRIYDRLGHRCLAFHSDSTWPEGLPDYVGSTNGGIPAKIGE